MKQDLEVQRKEFTNDRDFNPEKILELARLGFQKKLGVSGITVTGSTHQPTCWFKQI
jgi:hypothetical protein